MKPEEHAMIESPLSQTQAPTVFVVDDDAAARHSARELVRAHGMAAEEFSSAEEFLAAYDPSRPGCMVLDLRMEGLGGLALQERLNEMQAQIPVIVITAHADVPSTVLAMRRGAVTLMQKPYAGSELWEHIQEALAIDARRRQHLAHEAEVDEQLATLTLQERRVLTFVLQGELNKAIARKLGVSERTVERDRSRMMQKLGVKSVAQLVQHIAVSRKLKAGEI